MQLIALIAIVFAAVQWGSQSARFGVALALVALIAFLAGGRWSRTKLLDRDAAWIAALQQEEHARRKLAANIEHADIEKAVQFERGANVVQMAAQAALSRVRRDG